MAEEVLLLADSDRVALAVVRSLGRAGFAVSLAVGEGELARSSRHTRASVQLPDPLSGQPAVFAASVRAELERRRPAFLFATGDVTLAALADGRAEIAGLTRLVMPSAALLGLLNDRREILVHAAATGIRMPLGVAVDDLDQAQRLAAEMSFPVRVRPARRVVWGKGGRGARERGLVAFDCHAFLRSCAEILTLGPAVAEIPEEGRPIILDLLWAHGEPVLACQVEALAGRGALRLEPCHSETMAVDPELVARARAFVSPIGPATGLIAFEFIERNGDFVLTDARPGPSPTLALAMAAGVDLPRRAVELARDASAPAPPARPSTPQVGLRMRHLTLDLAARREQGWRGLWRLIPDWFLGAWLGLLGREHLEVERGDDLAPAVSEIRIFGARAAAKVVGVLRLGLAVVTHAASGAPRRTRAHRVLVLCDGNICRSPYLEHRLRARLGAVGAGTRVTIESGGLKAALGHPAPPLAGEAAARHGVELAAHRSQPVTLNQVASSNLVLVMTVDQRDRLLAAYPQAAGKVALAARYDPMRIVSPEIPDPAFGDAADFDRVYSRLARIADGLASSLARATRSM